MKISIVKKVGLFFLFCLSTLWLEAQVKEANYRSWVRKASNKRLALVIGNSEYQHGGKLRNPAVNAQAIKSALETRGYDVELGYNLGLDAFYAAADDFADKLSNYESALIFYAGHGLEIAGKNYLVPIDANPQGQREVPRQCFEVEDFFKTINDPEKPKIIVLDACRSNPFAFNSSRGNQGMKGIEALRNSKMIFSTAEGTVVKDNNPFTDLLSNYIKAGGCIDEILGKVSKEVRLLDEDQLIWQEGLLEETVCFGDQQQAVNFMDSDDDGITDVHDECPLDWGSIKSRGCPDQDEDGVPDKEDECPQVWGDTNGCPDKDKDGVPDIKDACPDEHGNGPDGCRIILNIEVDNDLDGIPNKEDKCPNEKGSKDNNGCPDDTAFLTPGPTSGTFTDTRDQTTYKWVKLRDNNIWLAENLRFEAKESWCYKKKNCTQYGRLYTWAAAQKACPEGWRLATKRDWEKLKSVYDTKASSYRSLVHGGDTQFEAMLGGLREKDDYFSSIDKFGNFWTKDEMDSASAYYYSFNSFDEELYEEEESKEAAFSCRCIKGE